MRTASCLTLVAIGAILTFAVTGSPGFLNLQVAGVVVMATGIAGLFIRRPAAQGWLRRRTILRDRTRGTVVGKVEETRYPPYVMLNPGAPAGENGHHGMQPGDLTAGTPGSDTVPDVPVQERPADTGSAEPPPAHAEAVVPAETAPAETEIVDEYIEE